jgi:hypothetical protein
MSRRLLFKLGLSVLTVLAMAASALAYWTTHGFGTATATVSTLNAPTNVSVPSTASGTVHVTWTGSTLGDGVTPASGYYVTRIKNSDSSTANACGTSPAALTSSTSCDDTSVPNGTYHYTVTAVFRSWTATSTASGDVVLAAGLDHFAVTAPASATAGSSFNVAVAAKDASNTTLTGYSGTVHFASSDPGSPVLPSNYTFVAGDNGSHTFTNGVTLKTTGSQTITVNDAAQTSKTGTATVSVSAASLDHFVLTAPANATAGSAFNAAVIAKDSFDNTVASYSGTVHFVSSDTGSPVLPSNYTFVAGDNGSHTFTNGVTLKTAGSQTITVNDTAQTSKTGTATISVSAAAADHFKLTSPASATAGTAFNTVTLTAQDAYNNTATSYANGNHAITWSGAPNSPNGTAPSYPTATVSFTSGISTTTLSATLFKAGSNSLTATATAPSLTGTATVGVNSAGVALSYNRTCPVAIAKNSTNSFTINVPNDAYGNPFTNPTGIAVGLSLSNTSNFGFGAVGTGTTTVTITTGPATNTFSVVESGANKATTLTAPSVPSGFTAPPSCTINAGN